MTSDGLRSEEEILAELARIEQPDSRGSYEELAAAAATLRWVLGEEDYPVVDWSRERPVRPPA